jgi:hypothetical protein
MYTKLVISQASSSESVCQNTLNFLYIALCNNRITVAYELGHKFTAGKRESAFINNRETAMLKPL